MKFRDTLLCGVAFLVSATAATHVAAQTATSAAAPSTQLGEVVVTARRRQESLQKVPEAITAFSQQMLKEKAISNAFDLNTAVPGLTVEADSGNGSRASFAIRGRGLNYGAAAGSVETYFADVPLSGPFQMPSVGVPFFDLQSLQVLKGPQGTLFGRSTTGGAVLFVPQAPSDRFGGYVRVQGGDYNDVQLEGAVNIPLMGDFAELRLAGFSWNRDGYSHTLGSVAGASPILGQYTDLFGHKLGPQTYDNQQDRDFRATLVVHPTADLTNSTIFAFHNDENRSSPKAQVINPNSQLGGGILFLYPDILKLGARTADFNVNLDRKPSSSYELINTTTDNLTSNLTIKNIFGYIAADGYTNAGDDTDGSPLNAIDLPLPPKQSHNYQFTDEVQLQGHNLDNRLSWIVGGLLDDTREPDGNNINVYTVNNSGTFDTVWQQNTFTNYGVFGSATYKITDQISITAGERHSWDKIEVIDQEGQAATAALYLANSAFSPQGAAAAGWTMQPTVNHAASFQGDTYNIGLEDQLTHATLVYGGYRRGFKPGGFNAKAPSSGGESAFAPETDDDFYLGLKTDFNIGGVPGRFNLEGYWDLYHGKQVSYLTLAGVPGGAPTLATVTINVPQTTYRGIDADITLDPTPWLRVTANYSYIDAYFTQWPDPTFPTSAPGSVNAHLDLKSNPVAYVSPNKVSLTARFHTQLSDNRGEVAFAPTFSYQDRWYQTDNGVVLPQGETSYLGLNPNFNPSALGGVYIPSYSLLNLRFEWNRILGSKVDGAVNVTNVTDKVFETGNTGTLAFGVQGGSYGPPRMVSVDLSTKF